MNKFKVGDLVEILPLTDAQKREYPPTWMKDMDNYIGLVTTVERVIQNSRYKLKNTDDWTWHEVNLDIPNVYQPY